MRRRLVTATAVVAFAAALVAAAALGAGGSGSGAVKVDWEARPQVFVPPLLPGDRVMSARLRNRSLRPVDLAADRVRLLDADGKAVRSTARFLQTYVHGRYSPSQRPATPNATEQRQLGEIVTIRPSRSAPVTLSWRLPPGGKPPVRADFGPVSLPLP